MNVLGAVAKGLGDVVLGSGGPSDAMSEAVESLLERIATVFLPEDRQVATAKLKELVTSSAGARVAFGQMGFPVLREVIIEEASDVEAIRGVLEILHTCVRVSYEASGAMEVEAPEGGNTIREEGKGENAKKAEGENGELSGNKTNGKGSVAELDRASVTVADLFCREEANLSMLLGLLSTNQPISDFYTRFNALKCLNSLLFLNIQRLQQFFVGSPTAMAKLMDLLTSEESMEVERNESLLLLIGLCRSKVEIQKLVVFEGIFDVLFNIVDKEQQSGVIVQDCMELLIHLLAQNSSNQLLFRESGHLSKLVKLIPTSTADLESFDQRIIFLALEILNVLMRPPSCTSKTDRKAVQDILCSPSLDLMNILVNLALKSQKGHENVSEPVMGQAFRCLSCLMLDNSEKKDLFASLTVQWTLNQNWENTPVLHCVLLRALRSLSPFERNAACALLETYCSGNPDGQVALASTVHLAIDGSEEDSSEDSLDTFGSSLLKAIRKGSAQAQLVASVTMALLVQGSPLAKDRIHSDVLSCFVRLLESKQTDPQARQSNHAVLKLLAVWLMDSTNSVIKFLSSPSHIPLIVQVVNGDTNGSSDNHTIIAKGLASVILGICVLAKVEKGGSGREGLFFTSSSVLDVVSKHIGLHKFFCCWDDLTSSNQFKHGLFPPRTAKVITKKEVQACFALSSGNEAEGRKSQSLSIVNTFFGYQPIFSSVFSTTVKDLQPLVKQGVVSSYSGPDTNTDPNDYAKGDGTNKVVDEGLVRKLQDEIKQLRSRNEDLATDLLAVSKSATVSSAAEEEGRGGNGVVAGAGGAGAGEGPKAKMVEQVDKKELMASKAKQAELDIALRESDKKVEDLERKLHQSGEKLVEAEKRCTSAQQESSKHENDLKVLSEAYNTLEEHSFNLESKIKDLEKEQEDKAQSIDKSEIEKEAEAKISGQLRAVQGELDNAKKLCSELMQARDDLKERSEGLEARVVELENDLREATSAKASSMDESMLAEVKSSVQKEMRTEMEEALRNKAQAHELEMESLKEQLQKSQAKSKEMTELYNANANKVYTEEELKQATENARNEAAADCDEEIYQLETKLRDMQRKNEEAQDADESMNDLLVCLGQEEKKTEILKERLQALGEDVDGLLEGLEDDDEDEDEDFEEED